MLLQGKGFMMRFRGAIGATAIAVVALAVTVDPADAQESIGSITATIDGEMFEWSTLAGGNTGEDYNTGLRDFGGVFDVSLMGFQPGTVSMRGAVQITFAMMSGSTALVDASVIHLPEGMRQTWMSPDSESPVSIDHWEVTASGAEVRGRIAGRLCYKESLFAEPDLDRCKVIEGHFASTLPRAQD